MQNEYDWGKNVHDTQGIHNKKRIDKDSICIKKSSTVSSVCTYVAGLFSHQLGNSSLPFIGIKKKNWCTICCWYRHENGINIAINTKKVMVARALLNMISAHWILHNIGEFLFCFIPKRTELSKLRPTNSYVVPQLRSVSFCIPSVIHWIVFFFCLYIFC